MDSKRLSRIALLTAMGLVLFVLEAQIPAPVPVPGIKLGLSNVITLFALYTLGTKDATMILFLRIVLGNLVVGNFMMMAYSLAGGLLALFIMVLLKPVVSQKLVWISSMFAAAGHNIAQLSLAIFVTGSSALLFYAPMLLLSALITGFFTGQVAKYALSAMEKTGKH